MLIICGCRWLTTLTGLSFRYVRPLHEVVKILTNDSLYFP